MHQAGKQRARNLGLRALNIALAAVVLCFQLMLAMHPYSHALSQQEAACQTCLIGNHSPPPVQMTLPPRLPAPDAYGPLVGVPLPAAASFVNAHGPRAPPPLILPA
ncbi:MAG TPA: hypothetical protein VF267_12450 [Gammaproteobacteria bacterium]